VLNGKQVDILVRRADGSAVSLEIAGATEKHEAHNALHCLSCAEVERHVIVCLGGKVMADVKRRIRAHEELKRDARLRIELLCHAVNGIDELIR
jgi:hypothetical protein